MNFTVGVGLPKHADVFSPELWKVNIFSLISKKRNPNNFTAWEFAIKYCVLMMHSQINELKLSKGV